MDSGSKLDRLNDGRRTYAILTMGKKGSSLYFLYVSKYL